MATAFRVILCAGEQNGEIKQFWRGSDSVPNQIYLRSPMRKIDVLSAAVDFNSLCQDTGKQSLCSLIAVIPIVCVFVCVRFCVCVQVSVYMHVCEYTSAH